TDHFHNGLGFQAVLIGLDPNFQFLEGYLSIKYAEYVRMEVPRLGQQDNRTEARGGTNRHLDPLLDHDGLYRPDAVKAQLDFDFFLSVDLVDRAVERPVSAAVIGLGVGIDN